MTAVILAGMGVLAGIALWAAIDPRSMWRASRWMYRHPDVHEPSDAAYAVQRVKGVITFVGLLVLMFLVWTML